MDSNLEKLASMHESDVGLSKVVRTQEGAKRFGVPVGSPITKKMREQAKKEVKIVKLDPAKGRVKNPDREDDADPKLFSKRVAELKKKIEKLDASTIRTLLERLEASKNLPKTANYHKIRQVLKKYLKQKTADK